MILAATSDLHGNLPLNTRHSKAPPIDILVFAGDICDHNLDNFKFMLGGEEIQQKKLVRGPHYFRKIDAQAEGEYQLKWAEEILAPWVNNLKPKHVVWVNGNHDFLDPTKLSFVTHGLKTGSANITLEGIKIGLLAGSMPYKGEWNDEVGEYEMKARITTLEDDIEILVSHVPPYGILDTAYSGDKIGCVGLVNSILGYQEQRKFKKIRHHFFGHVHERSGDVMLDTVKFHNMSSRMAEMKV